MPRASGLLIFSASGIFAFLHVASSHAQQSAETHALTAYQQNAISDLVGNFQEDFDKKYCLGPKCRILVMNFTLASGDSCQSCRILSDAVARELGEHGYNVEVIPRDRLESFLERERIPSNKLLGQEALEWLGSKFDASQVLLGVVELKTTVLVVKAHLLRLEISWGKSNRGEIWQAFLPLDNLAAGLDPSEAFSPELKPPPEINGQKVFRFDELRPGMTLPSCTYMPNPPYTEAARKAKAGGTLKVEAVVTLEGKLEDARIASGLPYDLNQSTLNVLKTWRCLSGTVDHKPVPMLIPFEVSFKMY
jgi:TonB family protein